MPEPVDLRDAVPDDPWVGRAWWTAHRQDVHTALLDGPSTGGDAVWLALLEAAVTTAVQRDGALPGDVATLLDALARHGPGVVARAGDRSRQAGTLAHLDGWLRSRARGDTTSPVALAALERALAIRTEVLGAAHVDTLSTRHRFAVAKVLAAHPDALSTLHATLAAMTEAAGPRDVRTLEVHHDLAWASVDAGDCAGGLTAAAHVDATLGADDVLGPGHADLRLVRNTIADALFGTGRTAEARAAVADVHAWQITHLGPHHPHTIATALQRVRQATRPDATAEERATALTLAADAIEARAAVHRYGPSHPRTFVARSHLPVLLDAMGRLPEAADIARALSRDVDAALGGDDVLALRTAIGTALRVASTGAPDDVVEAERRLAEVAARTARGSHVATHLLARRERLFVQLHRAITSPHAPQPTVEAWTQVIAELAAHDGPDAPSVEACLRGLAVTHARLRGEVDAALTASQEATRICVARVGPDHPDARLAWMRLADDAAGLGRPELSADALAQATAPQDPTLRWPGDTVAWRTRGLQLEQEGRRDEADAHYVAGLARPGPPGVEALMVLGRSRLARQRGDGEAAVAFAEEARARMALVHPPHAPEVLACHGALAFALLDVQRPRDAERAARAGLDAWQAGPDTPCLPLAELRTALGHALLAQGDARRAAGVLFEAVQTWNRIAPMEPGRSAGARTLLAQARQRLEPSPPEPPAAGARRRPGPWLLVLLVGLGFAAAGVAARMLW
ncbi:MAG: tetratricopeptide repeat protein [Alphaproteobacteria bacterium]|nr:tetratricopeptide repeat protein [Alphaproteobacteria bacterium]